MRVLYFTNCVPPYIDPHPLSEEQVLCGPRWPRSVNAGKIEALATPWGVFDASEVAEQLPARQSPEVLVAYVDAYAACWPMNTMVFDCPRIAVIGDVHHGTEPISAITHYLRTEAFDQVFLCYTRQTAKWFKAAGVSNLRYCGPSLMIRPFAGEFRRERSLSIGISGQVGKHHPRRARMVQALVDAGLPFEQKESSQADSLDLYSRSLLTFNCSLNGDYNMRVLEALSAGACLLTDRLPPASGFPFTDGREVVCYDNAQELVEKARHLLANPDAAFAIAEAGQRAFNDGLRPEQSIAMVFDAVLHGRLHPSLSVHDVSLANVDEDRLGARIQCFEALQELNRIQERVKVLYMDDVAEFASDASALSRVEAEFTGRSDGPWDRIVASAASRPAALRWAPDDRILEI